MFSVFLVGASVCVWSVLLECVLGCVWCVLVCVAWVCFGVCFGVFWCVWCVMVLSCVWCVFGFHKEDISKGFHNSRTTREQLKTQIMERIVCFVLLMWIY